MQALRQSARLVSRLGVRHASASAEASTTTAESHWAPYFPKPAPTAETTKKNLKKELVGFAILGPVGIAFMLYDFVVGLEEEHEVVIPPYPWMRIRRVPGMPWGDDGLFEKHPKVATEWPPADGLPEAGHGHH